MKINHLSGKNKIFIIDAFMKSKVQAALSSGGIEIEH